MIRIIIVCGWEIGGMLESMVRLLVSFVSSILYCSFRNDFVMVMVLMVNVFELVLIIVFVVGFGMYVFDGKK